ncbi:MAG: NACHT domain-containing protein, partial [Magnetococcales bacterium]|nr:NACHT domain-containing protein [Magnetococcales bacterium]
MASRDPILILHLSDLHFGKHSRFAGMDKKELGSRFASSVREERDRVAGGVPFALAAVTGDVAEAAFPDEYEEAQLFFEVISDELEIPRDHFLFAPGNHDVSWSRCLAVAAFQDEEGFDNDELRQRMDGVKFKTFQDFLRSFYRRDPELFGTRLGSGVWVFDFPKLSLTSAILNSCELESHRIEDHVGSISKEQAQGVMDHWQGDTERMKLVLLHHNPDGTVPGNIEKWMAYAADKSLDAKLVRRFAADLNGVEGRPFLERLVKEREVQLLLHGHHHASGHKLWSSGESGVAPLLSAGSWACTPHKLPKDEPNACQLVLLDPAEKQIRNWILKYDPQAPASDHVTPGRYIPNGAKLNGESWKLHLPAHFQSWQPTQGKPSSPLSPAKDYSGFLQSYRDRMSALFGRWDLKHAGVAQSGGAGRPIDAGLEAMYLPLRLGEGFDPNELDRGAILNPDSLLERERPLVIRGVAGSGKTTWMRWTFRQLLQGEVALPIMVELRNLARLWNREEHGEKLSLEGYLEEWLSENRLDGKKLTQFLTQKKSPRPVLLVDGWDELGELGEDLRAKLLGFMKVHPRVLVVVSSRPYGDGRPSHSDGFEVLDIQPLNDAEINTLGQRFFQVCYGEEENTSATAFTEFQEALSRSPDAQALSRTALLLTMMLLISRSSPLPDERHRLYELCIENFLTALPDRKEKSGAQLGAEHWRPEKQAERIRVTAELAFRVQEKGYEKNSRSTIVLKTREMARMLPEGWGTNQRFGFLAWLAGPAGVLVDRTDGTLAFAHLSFQEFLTAWHLKEEVEGDSVRLKMCQKKCQEGDWWETLRLWGALVGGGSPGKMVSVLQGLLQDKKSGLWFAGALLADGIGEESVFDAWLQQSSDLLLWQWFSDATDRCFQAWGASRQEERRNKLTDHFQKKAASAKWISFLRLEKASELANLPPLQKPSSQSNCFAIINNLEGSPKDDHSLAVGRILSGGAPGWPGKEQWPLMLLQCWPAHRLQAGLRLQSLANLTSGMEILKQTSKTIFKTTLNRDHDSLACDSARSLAHSLGRYWARDWARDSSRYLTRYWTHNLTYNWTSYWAQHMVQDISYLLTHNSARDWAYSLAYNFARNFANSSTYNMVHRCLDLHNSRHNSTHQLKHDLGLAELAFTMELGLNSDAPVYRNFVHVELFSIGRISPRFLLANTIGSLSPELDLFRYAARLSFNPSDYDTAFINALKAYKGDPLWPALAKHIARRSSEGDRALLIDLAKHPEKREPPLSWGLQFIVRG